MIFATQIQDLMTGRDGPLAPIADPATYSWPETLTEASPVRMARVSIAAGLHHERQASQYLLGDGVEVDSDRWITEHTAATALCDRAVLLLALQKADPFYAAKVAADLWHTAGIPSGTEGSLNFAARAMGIPLPDGSDD